MPQIDILNAAFGTRKCHLYENGDDDEVKKLWKMYIEKHVSILELCVFFVLLCPKYITYGY